MAIVNLNKKKFEKEIEKLDEKIKDRIDMFGTPIEDTTNEEIQIEVFPNRPDLLSYQGFKRAFLAFLGKQTGLKDYKTNKPEKNYQVIIDSSVKSVRPFTACAIVKGLKLDDEKIKELIEIQEKLHTTVGRKRKKLAIGIYPLEKITLPITYKALEPDKIKFIPLEESREMSGLEILQRTSTGRNYAHLLAGKSKFPVFIDAKKNILSMPPIINSQLTGKISQNTKDVFVECSGFEPEILEKCLNIIITSLADMNGKIYQMELKDKQNKITPNLNSEKMKLSTQNANKLLGLDLTEKQIKTLIEKMGHNYSKGFVEVPAWRTDVLHEVDLIEDVAIAYGYENFIPEIPSISTIGQEDEKAIFKRKITEILIGLGLLEISTYHLIKKQENKKMKIEDLTEIQDSKTDYKYLRSNLTIPTLRTFSENIDSEYPQRIFEIGKVFKDKEQDNLVISLAPGNFTEIKQSIEYLSRMLDIDFKFKEAEDSTNQFITGRYVKITLNEKTIGHLGEIHPKNLKTWHIKMPLALAEISLENIYQELSK